MVFKDGGPLAYTLGWDRKSMTVLPGRHKPGFPAMAAEWVCSGLALALGPLCPNVVSLPVGQARPLARETPLDPGLRVARD